MQKVPVNIFRIHVFINSFFAMFGAWVIVWNYFYVLRTFLQILLRLFTVTLCCYIFLKHKMINEMTRRLNVFKRKCDICHCSLNKIFLFTFQRLTKLSRYLKKCLKMLSNANIWWYFSWKPINTNISYSSGWCFQQR